MELLENSAFLEHVESLFEANNTCLQRHPSPLRALSFCVAFPTVCLLEMRPRRATMAPSLVEF